VSRCRGCGADIVWFTLPSGKAMCVDAAPAPDGDYVELPIPAGLRNAEAERFDPENPSHATLRRYRNHWGTCAKREQFRRPR
jgi:hypothetical protein